MKFATNAARRANRLRRRARVRLTMMGIGAVLVLAGLTIPLVHSIQENLTPRPAPSIGNAGTSRGNSSQRTVTFQLSNGSETVPGSSKRQAAAVAPNTSTRAQKAFGSTPPEPLLITPSAITVYVNSSNAQGIKPGVLTGTVTVGAVNGRAIEEPFATSSSGLVLSGSADTPTKTVWGMGISADTSPGKYNLELAATSTSGQMYTGGIIVTVVPVPAFHIATSSVSATINRGTTNTASFSNLSYSAGGAVPTLSATPLGGSGGIACSNGLSYSSTTITCSDSAISNLPDGNTLVGFTFQNQFQFITVVGNLTIAN